MVGYFLVCFLVGVLWAVYEVGYNVKYFAVFTSPSSPAMELCWSLDWVPVSGPYVSAVVNDLLVAHWQVTGALLWGFTVGVFFILPGRRELGQLWVWLIPMHVQLLEFAVCCALIESKWSTWSPAFHFSMLCSSGDLLKVSTCWQSEERTVPVCSWWQGRDSCPGDSLCFSFFAVLRSLSCVLKRFFWKGRNVLGNLCKSAFSF